MKKIDLSARLSRKNTVIALVCIGVFLLAGIIVAVTTHSAFLKNAEAKIVNYSTSPSSDFSLRSGTLSTLVYKYADNSSVVDLDNVLEVSKNASYSVDFVLDGSKTPIDHTGNKFAVSDGQKYFVAVTVRSVGNVYQNKYIIELVKKSDYSDKAPDFNIKADGETNYIGIDE